jgi:hypothetical protein
MINSNTPTQIIQSDWFTIHPCYLAFMYALLYLSRSLCDYYLAQDPDPTKVYTQLWGTDSYNASQFIQFVLSYHSNPPDWSTIREISTIINSS